VERCRVGLFRCGRGIADWGILLLVLFDLGGEKCLGSAETKTENCRSKMIVEGSYSGENSVPAQVWVLIYSEPRRKLSIHLALFILRL
jgi:hypothetical protein